MTPTPDTTARTETAETVTVPRAPEGMLPLRINPQTPSVILCANNDRISVGWRDQVPGSEVDEYARAEQAAAYLVAVSALASPQHPVGVREAPQHTADDGLRVLRSIAGQLGQEDDKDSEKCILECVEIIEEWNRWATIAHPPAQDAPGAVKVPIAHYQKSTVGADTFTWVSHEVRDAMPRTGALFAALAASLAHATGAAMREAAIQKASKRVIALIQEVQPSIVSRNLRWCQQMNGALADLLAALSSPAPEGEAAQGVEPLPEADGEVVAEGEPLIHPTLDNTEPHSLEFMKWLWRAYRQPADGNLNARMFTRWNMEVAYYAGQQAERTAAHFAPKRWRLGAKNDGLFIIDAEPHINTDGAGFDWPDGPDLVLNVVALTHDQAQAIVDAHNAALQKVEKQRLLLVEGLEAETAAREKAEQVAAGLREALDAAWALFKSIRYHADNGHQDRPVHVRLSLISKEANKGIDAMSGAALRASTEGKTVTPSVTDEEAGRG